MKTIISVSLSTQEARTLQKLAKDQETSRSAVVRKALRQYERRQAWGQIRTWGRQVAREMNITSYDDIDRIAGKR